MFAAFWAASIFNLSLSRLSCSFWSSKVCRSRSSTVPISAIRWLFCRISCAAPLVISLIASSLPTPACSTPASSIPVICSSYCIIICSLILACNSGTIVCIIGFWPRVGSFINDSFTMIWAWWSWPGKAFIGNPWDTAFISEIGSRGIGFSSGIRNLSGFSIPAASNIVLFISLRLYIPAGACEAICITICAIANRCEEDGTFGSETGMISTRPSKSFLNICPSIFGIS